METVKLTPEQQQARKRRSRAIAWALVAFFVLVFLVTMAQLRANLAAVAAGGGG